MLLQGKTAAAWILLLLATTTAPAQEPTLPAQGETPPPQLGPAVSATPPTALPTPLPNIAPVPLPSIPAAPDLSQLDAAFKKSPMGKAAEEYRMHVEWRKLQNRAAEDPQVIAAKASAAAARTDLDKRKGLRIYYDLYYGRMKALATTPEVKAYVDAQKPGHLATTAQDHVRPSPAPRAPKNTPAPASTPIAAPKAPPFG